MTKCCGDGLTAGPAPARGARPRPGGIARGSRSTTSSSARLPGARCDSRSPGHGALRRCRPPHRSRRRCSTSPRRRRKVLDGHACVEGAAPRRPHRARRRRGWYECTRATRSAPTACGRRCARPSARPRRATSVSGTRSASTSPTSGRAAARAVRVVRARPAARLRRGRSRCPAAGPTSASASIGSGKVARVQDMKAAVARAARPSARPGCARPRRARGAPQGVADPGADRQDGGSPQAARSSSAMPPRPQTR